jgi:hypothetical protein
MSSILSENIINKGYTINMIPPSDTEISKAKASCFGCNIFKLPFFKKRYIGATTVIMTFQKTKKLQGKQFYQYQVQKINQTPYSSNKYDSNENIYCTIDEIQGDVKFNNNSKKSDYIVMYNFSDQKQQTSSQNKDTIEQQESIYVEILSPYINLRFSQQQNITSSDYTDDEHIYETIQVTDGNARFQG